MTQDAPRSTHWSHINFPLYSPIAQQVVVAGRVINFKAGETIRTECSYKFDEEFLTTLAESSGFRIHALYTDEREWFWMALLHPI